MAKALGVFLPYLDLVIADHVGARCLGRGVLQGQTIQFIVGGSAGGGYDTYTRLIARYFAHYVPGKPPLSSKTCLERLLIAANYVFNSAPRDGTVIGHWSGPLILQHMMGNPAVQFEGASLAGSVCRRPIPSYA